MVEGFEGPQRVNSLNNAGVIIGPQLITLRFQNVDLTILQQTVGQRDRFFLIFFLYLVKEFHRVIDFEIGELVKGEVGVNLKTATLMEVDQSTNSICGWYLYKGEIFDASA